jgi:hypothetical protein
MMKHFLKILLIAPAAVLMFVVDIQVPLVQPQPASFQLVSEAQAIMGVRRRSFRRGVVIGSAASASAAQASTAAAPQQQAAPAPAPAPQQPATAPQPGAKPIGTVVSTLPAGCTPVAVGNVEYQHCGVDYYRTAFQGNNLVYVTTQP